MSTAIKSIFGVRLVISAEPPGAGGGDPVAITPDEAGTRFYDRADFLAAVETECGVRTVPADAIVICLLYTSDAADE